MISLPKRKPKANRAEPAAPVLRGFVCAPNFGPWDEIGPPRVPYFQAEFRDGRRVPGIEPCEWDFRAIRNPREATDAVLWEYAREVEWVYDLYAEWFASCTHPESSAEHIFIERWTIDGVFWEPPLSQITCALKHFPIPWLELPEAERTPHPDNPSRGIRTLIPGDFLFLLKYKWKTRVHALQIDWSMPRSRLAAAFKNWMRENRPKDVCERKRSGTDAKDAFAKLKRLAAYRLKRAGLSRSKALELIREHTHALRASNPFDVLPCYSSEGRWSSSAKEAAESLERWMPDPRAGEIPILWPDDPRGF
jgi:hypothetical protein